MNILKPEEAKESFYYACLEDMSEPEKSKYYASLFDTMYDSPVSESTFDNCVNYFTDEELTTEQAISKTLFYSRMGSGPLRSEKLIGVKEKYGTQNKNDVLLFFNEKRLSLIKDKNIEELIKFLQITLLKRKNENYKKLDCK